MTSLLAGYRRFRRDVYPVQKARFERMAHSQHPHTLFITCSDSRVVPSMFTQTEPGELFICRIVGNLIPAHGAAAGGVVSAIEYAVSVLGVKQVIVCGHSDCGAMRAFLHPEKLQGLPAVSSWLEHASTPIALAKQCYGHLPEEDFLKRLTQENVISQMHHLRTHPAVAMALRAGKLKIDGWYFDIAGATVSGYDEDRGEFVALDRGLEAVPDAIAESEPAIA
jgi:carbonic anhydrase